MEINYLYLHGWPQNYKSSRMWAYRILGSRALFLLRFSLPSCCPIWFKLCTHLLPNIVYKYVTEHRISKLENLRFLHTIEICQNRSKNSIFCCFFVRLLDPKILKYFLILLPRWNFACSFLNTQTLRGFSMVVYAQWSKGRQYYNFIPILRKLI